MKIGNRKSEIENHCDPRPSPAFTLIELIIVISIIAILASLIFPVVGVIDKRKKISVAQTQLKALEAAIDGYKTKLGYYPPDNTNNFVINQLYFELLGTTNNANGNNPATVWVTMDNSAQLTSDGTVNGQIYSDFGILGLANTSTRAHSDDQGAAASTFINNLPQNQIGTLDSNGPVKILVCSVAWPGNMAPGSVPFPPKMTPAPISSNPTLNPFYYNSSHPTNNATTYDLSVDVVIKNKVYLICNWSAQPIQL